MTNEVRHAAWVAAIAVVVLVAGGLAWDFAVRGAGTQRRASPSVRRILASPQDYVGRRVVVTGQVDGDYGPQAITLGTPLGPGLLVTARSVPQLLGAPVRLHEVVRVTGTVRRFGGLRRRRGTGGSSDAAVLATFDGKPVVHAAAIVRVGGQALVGRAHGGPARPELTTTGG